MSERPKHLTKDQSVLALSLLTDVVAGKRHAVTFLLTEQGHLIEISPGKILEKDKPPSRKSISEILK